MTNVIPFRSQGQREDGEARLARDSAALISDLVDLVVQIRDASERAASLSHPRLRVEHSVQLLLDAMTAVERAAEVLTDDGEYLPF